jgi:hypothetical protein
LTHGIAIGIALYMHFQGDFSIVSYV